jgi:hypothetical protein
LQDVSGSRWLNLEHPKAAFQWQHYHYHG